MCLSELSSNRAFRVLTFLLVVSMVLAPFPLGRALAQPPGPSDEAPSGPLHQVRSLEVDELRTAKSEGLAYTTEANAILSLLDVNAVQGSTVNPENGHVLWLDSAAQAIQELTPDGKVIASYSYSDLGLRNPRAMVFAPTPDLTDDPARTHLYVADAGQAPFGGDILELSFEAALVPEKASVATSSLIQTINTESYPAPDPAGITFVPHPTNPISGTLWISDSEVEEMAIFTGKNLYQTTLTGSLVYSSTTIPYTNEPTGLALNRANGRVFVSDDGEAEVYQVDPATATVYSTISTSAFGCLDAEGVAYYAPPAPNPPELWIADGVNSEVYRVNAATGALLSHFDTEALGVTDVEGIDVDPTTGDAYLIGSPRYILARISQDGLVLRLFNISNAQTEPGHLVYKPAALALGVRSNKPSENSMYIADRGLDNGVDPNENDGRVYEVTLPKVTTNNKAALVNAGAAMTITLPASATLNGTVTDPVGDTKSTATTTWSKASGPGTVTFGNPTLVDTTATFTAPGTYVLQLWADDGELIGIGRVTVIVKASDGAIAIDTPVGYEDDDAEERANGSTNVADSLLELVRYNGTDPTLQGDQTVGLRFRDLAIPPGAQITNAYIQFTVASATSAHTSLTIRGQSAPNAPVFVKTSAGHPNISTRTPTAASVAWSAVPSWTTVNEAGPDQRTPDLKAIVEEIVALPGWVSGNAMAFIITGTGQRVAWARAGETRGQARLHIEYLTFRPQTIIVTTHAPASAAYGTGFTVAATGGASGNPVTYSASGGCSNVNATFTMTSSTEPCTVHYNQAGNALYAPAPEVTEVVTATKANQTITVTPPVHVSAVYNTSFTVAATASSGLPVAITSSGVCTGNGNGSANITMTSGTGTCTVHYNQAGNTNYNTAPEVTEVVSAEKAGQSITVTTHAPAKAVAGSSFTVAAAASSGLAVAYTSSGSCTNSGATFTVTDSADTCTVHYNQAGNTNYSPAPEVTETTNGEPRRIYLPFILR